MTPDDAYLAALKRRDAAAVERLVADYEGPLFRYFLTIHSDPGLAGDQSADTFVELVRVLPRMRGGPEQLRGFVYAVARNVERRRWRTRPTGEQTLDNAADIATGAPDPTESLEQQEQLARALRAISGLDPITREVFLLAFVEQLPLADVAQALEMPIGTVKTRIHRGRRELRTVLDDYEVTR